MHGKIARLGVGSPEISVAVHQHLRPPKNDASQGLVTDPRANSMQQCELLKLHEAISTVWTTGLNRSHPQNTRTHYMYHDRYKLILKLPTYGYASYSSIFPHNFNYSSRLSSCCSIINPGTMVKRPSI